MNSRPSQLSWALLVVFLFRIASAVGYALLPRSPPSRETPSTQLQLLSQEQVVAESTVAPDLIILSVAIFLEDSMFVLVIEDYANQPVMLNDIKREK